jgi:selenide,water dikinase
LSVAQQAQKPRIRLTALSHGAGCACKLGPDELSQVLAQVPQISDPRVLVDAATRDDAAVFQLSDERALVVTVDFFTPIVDDPYAFGAIAAANALSDIYAMGATPLLTLNLVAWPRDPAILPLLGETLRGGADIAREAGALILGGHSIDDPEPKYGMVAVGEAHPKDILTNAGAKPADRLVLTKPLGTGILTTALKRDLVGEAEMVEAVRTMTTLNAGALRAIRAVGTAVHAATDVTGFGLLNHLHNILAASRCGARLMARRAPALGHALDLVKRGAIAGGTKRNGTASEPFTRWAADVSPELRVLLNDAQTSGGLLIAVAAASADALVAALKRQGTPAAAVIGELTAGDANIEVVAQ